MNMNKVAEVLLDIDIGDIVLTGRYKNKRKEVKELGTDELGQPTINGQKLLAIRIEKKMPKNRQSAETQRQTKEATMNILLDGPLGLNKEAGIWDAIKGTGQVLGGAGKMLWDGATSLVGESGYRPRAAGPSRIGGASGRTLDDEVHNPNRLPTVDAKTLADDQRKAYASRNAVIDTSTASQASRDKYEAAKRFAQESKAKLDAYNASRKSAPSVGANVGGSISSAATPSNAIAPPVDTSGNLQKNTISSKQKPLNTNSFKATTKPQYGKPLTNNTFGDTKGFGTGGEFGGGVKSFNPIQPKGSAGGINH